MRLELFSKDEEGKIMSRLKYWNTFKRFINISQNFGLQRNEKVWRDWMLETFSWIYAYEIKVKTSQF